MVVGKGRQSDEMLDKLPHLAQRNFTFGLKLAHGLRILCIRIVDNCIFGEQNLDSVLSYYCTLMWSLV